MGEEERAALHRANREACRVSLLANERTLAGDAAARVALTARWEPLRLAVTEAGLPDLEASLELTPSNRGPLREEAVHVRHPTGARRVRG